MLKVGFDKQGEFTLIPKVFALPKHGQSARGTLLEEFLMKKIKCQDDKEKTRKESANDSNAKMERLAKQSETMTSTFNGFKLHAAKVYCQ